MARTHITLLLGAASSGKTEMALQALERYRAEHVLLLVPGALQRRAIQARVKRGYRGRVYQFYDLACLVVPLTGEMGLPALSETARTLLLREVLRELVEAGELPTFARVAHKPGFIATVGEFINEARQARVLPQALATAGITPYDAELGIIYAAYCTRLQQPGYADIPHRLELARDALYTTPDVLGRISLLIVDGFDQFTPLQLSLLMGLTQHIERTIITLTGGTGHRSAHRRFIRTRQQLVASLQPELEELRTQSSFLVSDSSSHLPHPTLAHLEAHLFELPAPDTDQGVSRIAANGAVLLIKAADREREVRAVLRRGRALLSDGVAPEQIAILLRSGEVYVPLLREIAAEYDLPLAINHGFPLNEAPAICVLLTMLHLSLDDYPCPALAEVWRSIADGRLPQPALEHDTNTGLLSFERAASLLDRVAHTAGIPGGMQRLQKVLQKLAGAPPPLHEEDAPAIMPADATGLLALFNAFVAWLTPLPQATLSAYVSWVRERTCMENDDVSASPPTGGEVEGSRAVYQRWGKVLAELADGAVLINERTMTFAAFLRELTGVVRTARYGRALPGPGSIAVLPILAARGLHFDHVIVPGMADGEFPLILPDPPFYSHRERALLVQRDISLVPPDPADERSLFYETVARARRSLTLAYTYLDDKGNPLPISPYVTAVLDLLQPESIAVIQVRAGSTPTLSEAASSQEKLIALMDPGSEQSLQLAALDPVPLFEHVHRACEIEQEREGNGEYGPFEGVLHDPEVLAHLAEHFGPAYLWSVTQFNDYITCPFRFAAAHVLKLSQRSEKEEGLSRASLGKVYHAILAKAGAGWRGARYALTPEHEASILTTLHSAVDEVLTGLSAQPDFVDGLFWVWEQTDVRHRLTRSVRRALHDSGDWAEFHIAGIEKGFGPRYSTSPLRLETAIGPVLVVGRIDRLDQRTDGALALIDYKSSSSPRPLSETTSGRDVQLTIYLLAAERLVAPGERVERAAFLHLGSGKRSLELTDEQREEALSAMHNTVTETVQGVRAGNFAVRPRDKCPVECAFVTICRRNLVKRDDQAR